MFIFYGQGANGKSMIMEHVYKMFFTKENMSALSLNTLSSESSFARHKLMHSRINFATEQKAGLIESEELKKIISGETISVDRKNRDWIDIEPNCKVLIAANRLPYFKDTTHGTDRRLHIFYFPNRFMHAKEYAQENDREERGIYLAENEDVMIANLKAEASAILNIFLVALQDLKKSGWYFPPTKNSQKIKQEYKEESDPVGSWLRETYERGPANLDNIVTTRQMVLDYQDWNAFVHASSKPVSSTFMAKKAREVFGIAPFRYNTRDVVSQKPTSLSAFHLRRKDELI